jgi:hypothetical protein
MHTPVPQQKFDELVASTTQYLQTLMDKTADLEARLATVEKKLKEKQDG